MHEAASDFAEAQWMLDEIRQLNDKSVPVTNEAIGFAVSFQADDAVKIIEEAKPEMAVLTHFGMQMIFKIPGSPLQNSITIWNG